ncbi:hypothetical protein ACFL6N_03690 [Thermodesulfobacteriota bacterium]
MSIIRISDELYEISERGYRDVEMQVPGHELGKVLKTIIKREFPRSRKVRVNPLLSPEEKWRPKKKL